MKHETAYSVFTITEMNQAGERPYLVTESGFIVVVMRISVSSRTDRLVYVCLCNTAAVTDFQPPVSQHFIQGQRL